MAPEDRVIAYLEGELTDAERAAFERDLAGDTALRELLDRARAVDASLARSFGAPEGAAPPEPATAPSPFPWRRVLPYAALLALVGAVWAATWWTGRPDPLDAARAYHQITPIFQPQVICDSREKFEEYTRDAYGTPITADFDAGVTLVGWRYIGAGYNRDDYDGPRILLARAPDGTKVLAVFQDAGRRRPTVDGTLNVFRARVGPADVYEITPLEAPAVLGVLRPAG